MMPEKNNNFIVSLFDIHILILIRNSDAIWGDSADHEEIFNFVKNKKILVHKETKLG